MDSMKVRKNTQVLPFKVAHSNFLDYLYQKKKKSSSSLALDDYIFQQTA